MQGLKKIIVFPGHLTISQFITLYDRIRHRWKVWVNQDTSARPLNPVFQNYALFRSWAQQIEIRNPSQGHRKQILASHSHYQSNTPSRILSFNIHLNSHSNQATDPRAPTSLLLVNNLSFKPLQSLQQVVICITREDIVLVRPNPHGTMLSFKWIHNLQIRNVLVIRRGLSIGDQPHTVCSFDAYDHMITLKTFFSPEWGLHKYFSNQKATFIRHSNKFKS